MDTSLKNIKNKVYRKDILRRVNDIQIEHYWNREGLGSEKWEGFVKIRNMGIHGGLTEQAGKLHGLIIQVERYSCHQKFMLLPADPRQFCHIEFLGILFVKTQV